MEFTPTKQPIINSQNQRCKVPLTSANKLRRITVSPNAVIREVIDEKKNFAPLVNITPQCQKKYEEYFEEKNENYQKLRQLYEQYTQLKRKLQQGALNLTTKLNQNTTLKYQIDESMKRKLNKKQTNYAIKQALQRKQKLKLQQFVVHTRKLQKRRQMYINLMDVRGKQDEKIIRTIDKLNKFHNDMIDVQRERAVIIEHNYQLVRELNIKNQELDVIIFDSEKEMNQLADAKRKLDQNLSKNFDQEFQVAILKMQLSPNLKIGFDAVINEQDKETLRRLLQNQSLNWPKTNVRPLNILQMRYYILIQLYPKWQNILARLSYNFVGYRQIFGEKCPQQKQSILDMGNYVRQSNGAEQKSKKTKNSVVLVSKQPHSLHKIRQLFYDLQSFDNSIIRIHSVQQQITSETTSSIRISYTFYGQQRKKQFQIIWVQDVNIETIKKIAHQSREGERIILNIEVPLVCSSHSQLQGYTAIWQFCKKS